VANHPITPPPELVQQWIADSMETVGFDSSLYLATRAAQWGADQELEACCELLQQKGVPAWSLLRLHRRPKPPSLKQLALEAARIELDPNGKNGSLILRALEALPDEA
jgi:hypothetical protein